jgi:hypothetical protein
MHIQNDTVSPAASQCYIQHPATNKLDPLNCWYDSLMYDGVCSYSYVMINIPISIEKILIVCWLTPTLNPFAFFHCH